MKILQERHVNFETSYYLYFALREGSGFSFSCSKEGVVDENKLHPCAIKSYKECMSGTVLYRNKPNKYRDIPGSIPDPEDSYANLEPAPGPWQQISLKVSGIIQESVNKQVIPAIGECNHCARQVVLYGFTNTCECGIDYNMSGQQLCSREEWGTDTGEHLSDILRIR